MSAQNVVTAATNKRATVAQQNLDGLAMSHGPWSGLLLHIVTPQDVNSNGDSSSSVTTTTTTTCWWKTDIQPSGYNNTPHMMTKHHQ